MPRRAQDKLSEAQFFLEKIREVEPESQDFRFYFSALANASNSVTLILQKDLRGARGAAFDEWWSERKKGLMQGALSFEALRTVRNSLVHGDKRLPQRVDAQEFDEGLVQRLEVRREDHGQKGGLVQMSIHFQGDEAVIPDLIEGESGEEQEARHRRHVFDLIQQASEELDEKDFFLKFEGFVLLDELPPVAPGDLITSFEEYLVELEELLSEVRELFPRPEKTEPL